MSIAVGVRVWGVNTIGYNTDEAVYAGQAAAISQDPILKEIFPVFRAHPLLFQFMLAVLYSFGVADLTGRLLAVAIGTATIYVVYRLGRLLYDKNVGLLAALILALMPYHVIVTRQVLLDGPLVFCSRRPLSAGTIRLDCSTQMASRCWRRYGFTFLAKETGIILLGSVYAFLALTPEIRIRIRDLAISIILMFVMMAPFPISLWLAGSSTLVSNRHPSGNFSVRPNYTWDFIFFHSFQTR